MKDIPGYEGLYAITEDGEVWSYRNNRFLKNYYTKRKDGKAINSISLCNNGYEKIYPIHRLVALTYIPNLENKPTVDHIDRNPLNNNVNNLRWATYKEQCANMDYSTTHSKEHMKIMSEKAVKKTKKKIARCDKNTHEVLEIYEKARDWAQNDSQKRYIQLCAEGKVKSAYGFWWKYIDK